MDIEHSQTLGLCRMSGQYRHDACLFEFFSNFFGVSSFLLPMMEGFSPGPPGRLNAKLRLCLTPVLSSRILLNQVEQFKTNSKCLYQLFIGGILLPGNSHSVYEKSFCELLFADGNQHFPKQGDHIIEIDPDLLKAFPV